MTRLRPRGDDGSMAMFLVIAVVGMAIAALLMPMIVTTSATTRSDTSRQQALDAAQAGLNVMVGEIRAAQTDSAGTSTKLPCGSRSGTVDAPGAGAYTVSVSYYMNDPVNVPGAQPMTCVAGYGTYDPVSDSFTPRFALITSFGTDGPASSGSTPGRRLRTTYVFKTTNSNIVGGPVKLSPVAGGTTALCWDAGSATPLARAAITLQPCASPPKDQQTFAYRTDLTMQLVASVSATYPNGLCLDTSAPPTAGNPVYLGVCNALGSPPYTQQWSYNDNGGYTATLPSSASTGVLSSLCFDVPSANAGVALTLGVCTASGTQQWAPSPAVGPGAAQPPQLVNFEEFGRCLDITNQNVNSDHLIDYPCKQNPYAAAVAFNQKFTTPSPAAGATSATGTIYTTLGGSTYCLTSPATDGGYVTTPPCDGSARQTWTVYNGSASLPYSMKYTIVDSSSRCLGLTAPKNSELWSAIDVETCTGAAEQKWNATADLRASSLQNTDELP